MPVSSENWFERQLDVVVAAGVHPQRLAVAARRTAGEGDQAGGGEDETARCAAIGLDGARGGSVRDHERPTVLDGRR